MTACPDPGRWRAYLDGEAPAADLAALAAHAADCPNCQATLTDLRASADFAATHLAALAPAPSPAATRQAWQHVRARLDEGATPRSPYERIRQMLTRTLSGPARLALSGAVATLAVLLVLVLTPAGSQALQGLSIFRVQTFKAVTIEVDPATMPAFNQQQAREKAARHAGTTDPLQARQELERELAAAGVAVTTTVDERTMREVANVAAARSAARGAPVRTITALPPDYAGTTPKVYVAQPSTTTATVDLAKFRQALAAAKKDLPQGAPPIDPANLPGINPNIASISATLQTAFAVVQVYGEGETALVFAQGASPELTLSEGVDITAIRDAMLAMPALSKTTRNQILSIRDDEWTRTLILPVPPGTIVQDVTVGGALGNLVGGVPGLLIVSPDGTAGAVLWQRDGILYAVAGGHGRDVLLQAANSVK